MSYMNSMVRLKGLEPPHLSIPEPKSGASTSSATAAEWPYLPQPLIQGQALD